MDSPHNWHVYMLQCHDGTLYTGCTTDVPKRLAVHLSGKGAKYTKVRLPVKLVHTESGYDRSAALKREHALKKLSRTQKKQLIQQRTT